MDGWGVIGRSSSSRVHLCCQACDPMLGEVGSGQHPAAQFCHSSPACTLLWMQKQSQTRVDQELITTAAGLQPTGAKLSASPLKATQASQAATRPWAQTSAPVSCLILSTASKRASHNSAGRVCLQPPQAECVQTDTATLCIADRVVLRHSTQHDSSRLAAPKHTAKQGRHPGHPGPQVFIELWACTSRQTAAHQH